MALLSRSTSIIRFVAPPPRQDRDAIARVVTRHAFHEPEDDASAKQHYGWVGFHDPLVTDLTPADIFLQQYLVVAFRWDRRVVPPKLLYLERRRAEAALAAERGLERIGRTLRRQVKADVEAQLLARALPAPRLLDCVWNLDTGRVLLTGGMRAVREAFVELFRRTFGVAPVPLIPYLAAEHVGLPPRAVDAVRAVEPASLVAVTDGAPPDRGIPRLPLEERTVP